MGNEKWVVPIGIHDIDVLVSEKKHFIPSKILGLIVTNFVCGKDLVFFLDGNGMWVVPIRIHDIDALV